MDLVELEIFKTYIEANLTNGFIRPFKSLVETHIFFVQKLDRSFYLYMDYHNLNNLTIKNQYLLFLIGKLLDRLEKAKRFTQLDLKNTYHCMKIKEGDKWKTVFRTKYGHYEYQIMFLAYLTLQ